MAQIKKIHIIMFVCVCDEGCTYILFYRIYVYNENSNDLSKMHIKIK